MSRLQFILGALLIGISPWAVAQDTVTLEFDGGEAGVGNGATDFAFMGSNWSGGEVRTEVENDLYASGTRAYMVDNGNIAEVTFDDPIDSVEFFYGHGFGFNAGLATAFDEDDNEIDSVNSIDMSVEDDGTVGMDPAEPIARIEFDEGGAIDDFSYTTLAAEPPSGANEGPTSVPSGAPVGGVLGLGLTAAALLMSGARRLARK